MGRLALTSAPSSRTSDGYLVKVAVQTGGHEDTSYPHTVCIGNDGTSASGVTLNKSYGHQCEWWLLQ